jgi:hypothetical protein
MKKLLSFVVASLASSAARAETLQILESGKAVPAGKDRVICGDSPQGWTISADQRAARPPETTSATNRAIEVSIATSPGACARPSASLTLLATGTVPEFDAASVSFCPDEGRLDLKGTHREDLQIVWQAGNHRGQETCLAATPMGKIQHCVVPRPRKLPVNAVLRWLLAHTKDAMPPCALDLIGGERSATLPFPFPAAIGFRRC